MLRKMIAMTLSLVLILSLSVVYTANAESLLLQSSEKIDTDLAWDDGIPEVLDTDSAWDDGIPEVLDTDSAWDDGTPEEIDTDENWIEDIDEAGNLIIPGGATLETWKYYIEEYSLKYYVDAEDNLVIPAEEALRFWRGDANVDGSLDMLDVTSTQKYIADLNTECNTLLADMDRNGAVDLQDVVQMQKTIAKII